MNTVATSTRNAPMRALVYDGSVRLGQLPVPKPAGGELLVRVHVCALSRFDVDILRGRRTVQVKPVILGHQFVGEVTESGDARGGSWIGRRVISYVQKGCGLCPACRHDQRWLCGGDLARGVGHGLIDGALAEYLTIPVSSAVEVPASVEDEEAAFAHPVATALAAIDAVSGPAPQRVLVVGDGNQGLLTTLALHAAGHTVSVFGRHPSRRDLLWRNGISFSGVPADQDGAEIVDDDGYSRESYGTVIECSGRPSGFELALRCLRPRGRIVLMSDQTGEAGFDLRTLIDAEIEVQGVQGGSLSRALEFISRKQLDLMPLVAARLDLQDGAAAFQQAMRRGTLKVMIYPRGRDPRR